MIEQVSYLACMNAKLQRWAGIRCSRADARGTLDKSHRARNIGLLTLILKPRVSASSQCRPKNPKFSESDSGQSRSAMWRLTNT